MTAQSDSTKAAVLKLLASGQCTVAEAARLAGESRQLVRYWVQFAGIKPPPSRASYLKRLWREALAETAKEN